MSNIQSYISSNKQRFIDELIELLKIPSISADSSYQKQTIETAEVLKASLLKRVVTMLKFVKLIVFLLFMARK